MLKKNNKLEMVIKFLNLKFFFLIIFLATYIFKHAFSEENYIVNIVNNIPITKVDIHNRAKLISISINQNSKIKNIENYYNQSLQTLINEKVILSAGKKINKNLTTIVSNQANQMLLAEFENSKLKLDQFLKKHSISKSALLEKHIAQLIWGIVLRDKYKMQFSKIEKNIEQTLESNEYRNNEDLYDLAEIVINKNNNNILLKKINFALKDGANFLEIAKQISISSSSKFNGKIGWNNFQNLPEHIKNIATIRGFGKGTDINEGEIFTFPDKDKIKIIKVLAKRQKGKLSKKEDIILLAQLRFPINFQKRNIAYKKIKNNLDNLLSNKSTCDVLKVFEKENSKNLDLKVIKSRIADLSPKIENIIENINFFEISKPIFLGNNGYTYVKCDKKEAKLDKINYKKLKKTRLNKYFLIYSEKLIKRLRNDANILLIEKIK
jgi:peptidyl-prolyl cis-trans isomerase SurA